jgi:tetratricopeptide (TPR) repeat protein
MLQRVLTLVCAVLFLATAQPAHAAKVMFGTQDTLEKIQDVTIKGPKGEKLYLGYKFSTHSFVAPYWLSDEGYILGIDGVKSYFKLSDEQIKNFQASGALPNPLPPYEIGFFHYAFGNLAWIILVCIGVSIGFSMRADGKKDAARPIAAAGIAHAEAGNYDAAIAEYDKALVMAPKFVEVNMARGDAQYRKGATDLAISDYSKVINANKKHADALLQRGLAFRDKGLTDQSISDLTRAIKVQDHPMVRNERGKAYASKGDYKLAIADFTAVLKAAPEADIVLMQRAEAYDKSGHAAKAEADRQAAVAAQSARARAEQAEANTHARSDAGKA